jgi:GTP-binding protein
MPLLPTARFHTTVAALQQLPRDGLIEVAFVGRSNAGKSSAINVLCNRRRLAFSSRTPGRTQALNYFAVGPAERPSGYLVDTPGYGYASAPLETKKRWDQLAGQYLQDRPQLAGVVLLVDIRRQLTDLDRRLIGWVPRAVRLALVLTKSDKLGRQVGRQAMVDVGAELARLRPGAIDRVLQFSALNRSGSDELARVVENWLETGVSPTPGLPGLAGDPDATGTGKKNPGDADVPGRKSP